MAQQWTLYDSFREFVGDGTIDLDDDEFHVELVGSGYTPSALSHSQRSDLGAHILSGSGYSAAVLTSVTWTRDGGSVDWDADDAVFLADGGTLSPRWAVLLDADSADDKLVGYLSLGGVITMADGQALRIRMDGAIS